jgi:hypothetical protein
MKVWPIVTLGALIYGSLYADGNPTHRESVPHPRPRSFTEDDLELSMPHRVASIAYSSFFKQLLDQETEWSMPEAQVSTSQENTNTDDGEDPGKKLFWTHTYPGVYDPTPFPGWFDPTAEPDHPLVSPPACSSCRPDLFFIIIEDPAPPHEDENFALDAGNANGKMLSNLPFGELKAIDNLIVKTGPGGSPVVTILPCETIIVNGVCPLPCKGNDDPLCKAEGDPIPPVLSNPGGGVTPPVIGGTDPPPIIIGGGGSGGIGGNVGSVPEPSIWIMMLLGFVFMGYLGKRKLINE